MPHRPVKRRPDATAHTTTNQRPRAASICSRTEEFGERAPDRSTRCCPREGTTLPIETTLPLPMRGSHDLSAVPVHNRDRFRTKRGHGGSVAQTYSRGHEGSPETRPRDARQTRVSPIPRLAGANRRRAGHPVVANSITRCAAARGRELSSRQWWPDARDWAGAKGVRRSGFDRAGVSAIHGIVAVCASAPRDPGGDLDANPDLHVPKPPRLRFRAPFEEAWRLPSDGNSLLVRKALAGVGYRRVALREEQAQRNGAPHIRHAHSERVEQPLWHAPRDDDDDPRREDRELEEDAHQLEEFGSA